MLRWTTAQGGHGHSSWSVDEVDNAIWTLFVYGDVRRLENLFSFICWLDLLCLFTRQSFSLWTIPPCGHMPQIISITHLPLYHSAVFVDRMLHMGFSFPLYITIFFINFIALKSAPIVVVGHRPLAMNINLYEVFLNMPLSECSRGQVMAYLSCGNLTQIIHNHTRLTWWHHYPGIWQLCHQALCYSTCHALDIYVPLPSQWS